MWCFNTVSDGARDVLSPVRKRCRPSRRAGGVAGRLCRRPSFSRIKAGRAMYTCGRTLTQHTRRVTKLGNRRLSPQKHAPSGTPG